MVRDFAPTPWEPLPLDDDTRPRQSWFRAALKIVLVIAVMPILAIGVYYLANSGETGRVTFGGPAVGCATPDAGGVFVAGEPVFAAVALDRDPATATVLTLRLLGGTTILEELEFEVEASVSCDTRQIDPGQLAPGRYRVIYFAGEALLADGDFEVVASPIPA